MRFRRYSAFFATALLLTLGGSAAWSGSPSQDEYGMRGLRRVQVAFVDLAPEPPVRSSTRDFSAILGYSAPLDLKRYAQRDGASPEFSRTTQCQAITAAVAKDGLEVVDACPPDDLECGTVFMTMEARPLDGDDNRLYVVTIELSQRVQLPRDPAADISVPTTWSVHRFGLVSRHALAKETCQQLHDLAILFNVLWQAANK